MPARRPEQPDFFRVKIITPEEAEEKGIPVTPSPVAVDPATLSARTLWQTWDRDRGGWTKAMRLHPFLPLVKFSISAALNWEDEPEDGHHWNGTCWIVDEEHPDCCAMLGEEDELGLGMGCPLLKEELDPGWMNWRTNRIALSQGREHVEENLLNAEGRVFYADLICADLIGEECCGVTSYYRDPLYGLWKERLLSTKTTTEGKLYQREDALIMTPYIASTFETPPDDEPTVYDALASIGMTGHEAGEAMRFRGWAKEVKK